VHVEHLQTAMEGASQTNIIDTAQHNTHGAMIPWGATTGWGSGPPTAHK